MPCTEGSRFKLCTCASTSAWLALRGHVNLRSRIFSHPHHGQAGSDSARGAKPPRLFRDFAADLGGDCLSVDQLCHHLPNSTRNNLDAERLLWLFFIMTRDLIDLHIHLGGAVAPHVLWSIAHQQGFKLPVKNYQEFV